MSKHLFFKVVAVWFLLTQTLPPINLLTPFGDAMNYAIFMGAALLLFPGLAIRGSMVALLVYTLETLIYFMLGNAFFDTVSDVVIPFLQMGSAIVLLEYTFKYDKDFKFTRLALLVSIIATLVMSVISIPVLTFNPQIIRLAYSASTMDDQDVSAISSFVINWTVINGICFIIATIVFLCRKTFRENKKLFVFWLVTLLILYFIVFRSNIATPFVLCTAMIGLGILFGYERFTKNNMTKMGLMGIIIALLMTPAILIPILDVVQQNMDAGSSSQRIEEIKETLEYGEVSEDSDLGGRNELYNRSWKLFLESPIWGTSHPERISHHTYMIDRLACFGLLFIIPLIYFFVTQFKRVYKKLNHTRVTYMFGVFSIVFMLFFKGDSDSNWLFAFFLLPALCLYIEDLMDNRLPHRIRRKV